MATPDPVDINHLITIAYNSLKKEVVSIHSKQKLGSPYGYIINEGTFYENISNENYLHHLCISKNHLLFIVEREKE